MSAGPIRYETEDDFWKAEAAGTLLIQDAHGRLWLSWETEDGDRFAIRPRDNAPDDPEGPESDRWRPIGPVDMEFSGGPIFPIIAVGARDAIENRAAAEARSDAAWVEFSDRQGGI